MILSDEEMARRKAWLNRGFKAHRLAVAINAEINALLESADGLRSSFNTGGGGNDTADSGNAGFVILVERIDDRRNKLIERLSEELDIKREIEAVISQLDGRPEYGVLCMRCLSYQSWDSIADAFGYSKRHLFRLYNSGVARLVM